jgi:hypothetical protein
MTAENRLQTPALAIDYERSLWLAQNIRASQGACWENAARGLARWKERPADLVYVRGIALWAMPFLHAWLQVGSTVVDPTLVLTLSEDQIREDVRYIAVDTCTAEQVQSLAAHRALHTLRVRTRDLRVPPFAETWQAAGATCLNRGENKQPIAGQVAGPLHHEREMTERISTSRAEEAHSR